MRSRSYASYHQGLGDNILVVTFSISRLARKLMSVAAAEFDKSIKSNRMSSMSESLLRLSAMLM